MKRIVLWVIFGISVVLLFNRWQQFYGKPLGNSHLGQIHDTGAGSNSVKTNFDSNNDLPNQSISDSAQLERDVMTTRIVSPESGETIHVVTDLFEVDISLLGGNVTGLSLLKTGASKPSLEHKVRLFDQTSSHTYLAKSGLAGEDRNDNLRRFYVSPGSFTLEPGKNSLKIKLVSSVVNGLRVIKSYEFRRGTFLIEVEQEIENLTDQMIYPTVYTELIRDASPAEAPRFSRTFTGPVLYADTERVHKINFRDIDKNKVHLNREASNGWIAFVQHYFSTAWILNKGVARNIYFGKVSDNIYRIGYQVPINPILPRKSVIFVAKLFAGPSEERMLANIAPGLELVKDYGWMAIIAKPLFRLLEKLYSYIGNWGWAIVVLTMLIKILFFPLSATSYRSIAKMKEVGPRIQELRQRYKDEPQKLSAAMMEIYKKEKISPLGGCLPMLVQIPVFVALYWVLLSSVEMRGAKWIFWIIDLSKQDPLFILPILMTISMIIQTKLNPTSGGEPMQAKMMLVLPLFFSTMFFFLPSGLVLYYVVNNILSIAQQWYTTRCIDLKS